MVYGMRFSAISPEILNISSTEMWIILDINMQNLQLRILGVTLLTFQGKLYIVMWMNMTI